MGLMALATGSNQVTFLNKNHTNRTLCDELSKAAPVYPGVGGGPGFYRLRQAGGNGC